MTGVLSPCCAAAVRVAPPGGDEYGTRWYECVACGAPCDPVAHGPEWWAGYRAGYAAGVLGAVAADAAGRVQARNTAAEVDP